MEYDLLTILLSAVVFVVLTLTVAGVILLKPLSHRLGALLEAMAREKGGLRGGTEIGRLLEFMEAIEGRLSLLEERQDFEEALRSDVEKRGSLPKSSPDPPTR